VRQTPYHRERHPHRGAAGPDRRLRICRWSAALSAGNHPCAGPGRAEPFADETTLPALAPDSGKTLNAWLCAYARDDRPFGGAGPPMVAYRFEDSRSGDCVARHLAGFSDLVDGYAAYNRLAKGSGANDGMTLAASFAHVRRQFYELHVNESSRLATQTITTMAAL
jgi:transposase